MGEVAAGMRGGGGRAAWGAGPGDGWGPRGRRGLGAATPRPRRAAPPGSRPRTRACRAAITDRVSAYVVDTGHVPHEIDRGLNTPASQLGLGVQAAAVGDEGSNQHLPGRHQPPLGFASRVLSTRGWARGWFQPGEAAAPWTGYHRAAGRRGAIGRPC